MMKHIFKLKKRMLMLLTVLLAASCFSALSEGVVQIVQPAEYTSSYQGKVISIMGDSISTFAGYIPEADGFNLQHYARYPQDNLLTDVNETWWMQVIHALGAKLGVNESWRSTEVYNYIDAEVNSSYDGTKACMASTTRIQNLGSNGTPDLILFYGGTNDINQSRPLGSFDSSTAPSRVDLTSVKWDCVADAYVAAIMRMQYYYPRSQIVAMLPTFTNGRYSDETLAQYNAVFASICNHYGVQYIDLRKSGISNSVEDLPDGIHPSSKGMDYISDYVLSELGEGDTISSGDHIVYSVTHKLNNVTASLGYWAGVSSGSEFEETLSCDSEMDVSVTMNGVDITASCYADGKIFIPKVTGNLVITAGAKFSLGSHLQQIPANSYNTTNLWEVLNPENGYFKGETWISSYYSVTIPVTKGDRVWATSFGAAGENGGTKNGIRVTWFDENGLLETLDPADTYAEFAANGCLIAPENAAALCVTMWKSDGMELYLLNLPEKPAVYETHLQPIPAGAYNDTNLWEVLVPENGYFQGETWNDSYYSVTIPITQGDRIWANSFGVAGDNGGTRNGIRVTWFSENGMLATVLPDAVYAEFSEYGYLTAPEKANAVCVTMWKNEGAELYLLNLPDAPCEHQEYYIPEIPPACTKPGWTSGLRCNLCGIILEEQVELPALGHTEVIDKDIAATCTTAGKTEGKHCSVCGVILVVQNVIPALGHTEIIDKAIAATCTTAGKTEGNHCSACGEVLVEQNVVPALGHSEATDKAIAATCTSTGKTEGKHCTVCGEVLVKQNVIPAVGHSYTGVTVVPTCTKKGYTIYSCGVCNDRYISNLVAATGHIEAIAKAIPATCTAAGLTEGKYCGICAEVLVKQEAIPALGHTMKFDQDIYETEVGGEAITIFAQIACGHDVSLEFCSSDGLQIIVQDELSASFMGTDCGVTEVWLEASDGIKTANSCKVIVHNREKMELPQATNHIQGEAFAGMSVQEIVLPEGIVTIEERAFADCKNLMLINLPGESVISDDAFEGCDSLTIICAEGSSAQTYAENHGIPFVNR